MSAYVTTGRRAVGMLSFSGSNGALRDDERHERLLGVQAVLPPGPGRRARSVQHRLCDLLAVVRGEAVHDDRAVRGDRNHPVVDAEAGEVAQAFLALLVLAHA